MTATTVTDRLDINDPTVEVLVVTATNEDTYTCRKFGVVRAVQGTIMEDTTTLSIPLSFDISGAAITINCTGLSAKKVCLTIYGSK